MKAADACDDDFAWIDDEFLAHNVVELHQIADGAVFRFGAKSWSSGSRNGGRARNVAIIADGDAWMLIRSITTEIGCAPCR